MKRFFRIPLLILVLALLAVGAFYISVRPASAQSGSAQQAIDIAAAQPDIADALTHFPQWSAEAWEDDPDANTWYVAFYEDQQQEDWLGEALVDLDDETVLDYTIPHFLTDEEEAQQRAEVEALVLADAQVLALLGDPDNWNMYSDYDPYDAAWYVTFEHGLDAWQVQVTRDEQDHWMMGEIEDAYAFDEEEQQRNDRDKAIELAAESDAVWRVLEDVDDWTALASPLGGSRWGVSIVADAHEVYYLQVDIQSWQIIEEGPVQSAVSTYLPYHIRH